MSSRSTVTVVVGNAATSTAYSLLPLLVNGETFGTDKRVQLILQDANAEMESLQGVAMELCDCCFSHLEAVSVEGEWAAGLWGADLVLLPLAAISPAMDSVQHLLSVLQPLAVALEQVPVKPKVLLMGGEVEVAAYMLHLLAPSMPISSIVGVTARPGQRMAAAAAAVHSLTCWWQGSQSGDYLPLVVHAGQWAGELADVFYRLPVTLTSPCQHQVRTRLTDSPEWQAAESDRLTHVLSQCTRVKSVLEDSASNDLFLMARL